MGIIVANLFCYSFLLRKEKNNQSFHRHTNLEYYLPNIEIQYKSATPMKLSKEMLLGSKKNQRNPDLSGQIVILPPGP
jgi:hypothetical protein